jgi:predicted neuraminidase
MNSRLLNAHYCLLALIVLACAAAAHKLWQTPIQPGFQLPRIVPEQQLAEIHSQFVSHEQHISTHAASLIELKQGKIRAFWFAGSREGAADVEIRSAVFDGKTWGAEQAVINRVHTEQALLRFVKKIGNPVALRAPDGAIWLFYVTVSLGGWAGSSLTMLISHDEGATWSEPRRLITSPFINISTLIKGTPFAYQDGTIGLPIYHEFLGKFGELLRLAPDGKIIDKQRLSSGKAGIQPVMLIQNPNTALVLMRYTGAPPMRVLATQTTDGGQTWSTPNKTDLLNPDAAISGVALNDGRLLMVLNNLQQGRHTLSLMASADAGKTWREIYVLEQQAETPLTPDEFVRSNVQLALASSASPSDAKAYAESARRNRCVAEKCAFEFSYPYLMQTSRGDFHLVYTWNRSLIKQVQFSRSWLDARMKQAYASTH